MMRSSQICNWNDIPPKLHIRIVRDTKLNTSCTLTEFSVFSQATFLIDACVIVLVLKPHALTFFGSKSCFLVLILSEMLSSNGSTMLRAYASSRIKI